MHVGIPVMKCSLHPSNQVNKKTGKASKTCAVTSAWLEMNDERKGRDPTIDREMTHLNVWMEGSSSDNIPDIVQSKVDEINSERREAGKRALRSDAVSVAEIVEKPPIDYMKDLSYEEKKKFLSDSHEVMKSLINEWNPDWQVIAAVQHHDEFGGLSAHNHELVLLSSHDKNGVPTMQAKSELNLKFFNFINTHYSEKMREYGYDVEDVKVYDRLSEEEKEERKLHPKEHGVDAYIYKEKKLKETSQEIEELETKHKEISQKVSDAEQQHQAISEKLDAAHDDLRRIQKRTAETLVAGKKAEKKISAVQQREKNVENREKQIVEITGSPTIDSYVSVKEENVRLKDELSLKDKIIAQLQEQNNKLRQTLHSWSEKIQHLGRRMASALGFNESEYAGSIQEYPDQTVKEAYENAVGQVKKIDPFTLRVIPDRDNPNQYALASRAKDGTYKPIETGFASRESADARRRELTQAKKTLDESVSKKLDENLTRAKR